MKKSLIALAVLAASGVAMAQSSVTMYGVADLSLAKSSGSSARMSAGGDTVPGSATASIMNNGNSRLGVRGVEDLGGGLKASFNFEQGINAENGAADPTGAFQRNAFLALSGGFGRFQMGRTLTPSFWGVANWELTGAANYTVVGNQFGFGGAGSRNNSVFQYTTPNLGGFNATLGYIMKPDNGGNAKYDLNAIYRNGPAVVALTYNKTNGTKGNTTLGGAYDFGMVKVAGSVQNTRYGGVTGLKQNGFTIGATVPVGAFAVTLDIARNTTAKDTDFLLEGKYAMSKRTFVYAAYYKDGYNGTYDVLIPNHNGYNTGAKNSLGLGIRHNF